MFDHMFDSKEIAKKEFEKNMRELTKINRELKTIDLKISIIPFITSLKFNTKLFLYISAFIFFNNVANLI